ncbi:MAG TPA: SDR family oxidoreductase [Solirubrobacteraceae bacterium]|jgi:long-chain acyl-CoA synthetase|nr:SDR family oxidoreductase [Solirubrobacteraceae bacterium]
MSGNAVFLTGGTGFLGMEVLVRLLEQPDTEVIALVRAPDQEGADARIRTVLGQLYDTPPADAAGRVRGVPGDVTSADLGLSGDDRRSILANASRIVHCAASISFELPLDQQRAINVEGTKRVLQLASEMPNLTRHVHVSTAYVGGRHRGTFNEGDLDVGQTFRNSYEQSKYESELEVRAADLPIVTARPSIVVGDRYSGWTPAFNVIYWPLRAFARGMLEEVPADPDGIIDVVPIDYVSDALIHLLDHSEIGGAINLVAGRHAITNAQLIELACREMNRPAPRIIANAEMIEQASAYLPYFDVATRFDDRRAVEMLEPAGIVMDELEKYFQPILGYAQLARWGKTPLTRQGAMLARAA